MFKIQCIDHIVLRTMNMNKMVSFYCDIMGCHVENHQEGHGFVQLRAGDSLIDLLQVKTSSNELGYNLEHFCLRISPFNYLSLKEYFQTKDVHIYNYGKRTGAKGYGESFYLKDPDNNEIELNSAENS